MSHCTAVGVAVLIFSLRLCPAVGFPHEMYALLNQFVVIDDWIPFALGFGRLYLEVQCESVHHEINAVLAPSLVGQPADAWIHGLLIVLFGKHLMFKDEVGVFPLIHQACYHTARLVIGFE